MLFKCFRDTQDERVFITLSGGTGDRDSLPEFIGETLRLENSFLIICAKDREDYRQ